VTSAVLRHPEAIKTHLRRRAEDMDQPLRLLLIRDRAGAWPWVVQTIARVMAPVDVIEVNTLANALWRLGRERFDSVLLDINPADRLAADACRRHIADVAAIPVLDLHAEPAPERKPARPARPARTAESPPPADEPRRIKWPPRAGGGKRQGGRPAAGRGWPPMVVRSA